MAYEGEEEWEEEGEEEGGGELLSPRNEGAVVKCQHML